MKEVHQRGSQSNYEKVLIKSLIRHFLLRILTLM